MKNVAELFFLSLGFGTFFFTFLARPKDTGVGYIKLISSVSLSSLFLAFCFSLSAYGFESVASPLYVVTLLCLLANYLFPKEERGLLMNITYIGQLLCSVGLFYIRESGTTLGFPFTLSASLLLGLITYAMLQGHWYLVVPKMSEQPLVKAMLILWPLMFLKIALASYSIYKNWGYFEEGTRLGSGYAFNWLMMTMRMGWGYVIIGGMSYFAWRLVKMRSLQSATGILYAMTFFVLVGELVSIFLYKSYGLTL